MPKIVKRKLPEPAHVEQVGSDAHSGSVNLAIFPSDAGDDEFIWRLSMDRVAPDAASTQQVPLYDRSVAQLAAEVELTMLSRRDSCSHFLQILTADDNFVAAEDAQQCLLYCADGQGHFPEQNVHVSKNDVLILDELHAQAGIRFHLRCEPGSILYLVRISYFG